MTHRPPNGLLVFMSGHIWSVSTSTSLLVRTCWLYTDKLSADHTVLYSHVALTYDSSTVGQQELHQEHRPRIWQRNPAGYVQPAATGAPAACVAYGASGPCHGTPSPDLLSNRSSTAGWASITIITVHIANGCWLITSARVYCHCGCPIYRHIHEEMVPDFFRKFTRKTRPCAQTILYRFQWQFQCRRLGLSVRLIVGELVCRRVGFFGKLSINRRR